MNFKWKISSCIVFLGLLCGVAAVPIAVYGVPQTVDLIHALVHPDIEPPHAADALPVIALTGLLIGFATAAGFLLHVLRRIILPVREAAAFADRLAGGDAPPPMRRRAGNDEIGTLIAALNFLRDRQRNLAGKYQLSLMREAEIRRDIEHHDRLQLRILTRMVPEIRLPLGTIKGFALVARLDAGEDPELCAALEQIIRQVGRVSRHIERMIDIGRLGWGRWNRLEISTFDTAELVRELMGVNALSLQAREVSLVNHFSASAPVMMTWDRELLFQLLTIMVRAVGRVGVPGETVVISCFTERRSLVFEVRDSRHGECREDLVSLYREAVEDAGEGAPIEESASVNVLALCFVREIAEKAGGRFSVGSSAEAQTVLRFELDERDCCNLPQPAEAGRMLSGRADHYDAPPAAPEIPAGSSLRVLLGDDTAFGVRILTRLLGAEGIEVTGVRTIEAMDAALKEQTFDAVVLSQTLKHCDPVSEIRRLREVSGVSDLPVIVVGALLTPELLRQLHEMERVHALAVPLNYALLARLLYSGKGRRR